MIRRRNFSLSIRGKAATLALVLAAGVTGCGGGDDGPGAVDPGDPNSAMNNLLLTIGGSSATLMSGSPPAPSSSASAPKAGAGTAEVTTTTSASSTASIPVSFQSQSAMNAIFVKVQGSSSFFEADNPVGGKLAKAVPVSGNGQSFVLSLQLEADFQPGEFCFRISGRDSNNLVSNVVEVCTVLVPSISQPAEDQPTAAELLATLDDTWISSCQPFQTPSASGSARIGFSFDGSAYSQFVESWGSSNCAGNPIAIGTVVSGSIQIGDTPSFLPNSTEWATPFDFIPDAQSTGLGARNCFNVLRFAFGSGSAPDSFVLGLPVGFTVQGQADTEGSCVSVGNRPQFLSTDIVFTPGSVLPLNQLPVANAGPDQSVATSDAVQLNGSSSADADGIIATYAWTQTAGTTVTLANASTASPTFTAPNAAASLTFRLTVTDNSGATSQDTVNVTVSPNQPPVADAGADFARPSATSVQLNGTASSDPNGTIASYAWIQTAGAPVSVEDANTATPHFTAPIVLSGSTQLTFQLTVFDNNGASDTDTVVVTIAKTVAPTAEAGPDQSVKTGAVVTLDGSDSSDPDVDGSIASYAWTQTGGSPTVALTGANTATPSFTAPAVASGSIVLTFQLTVTDNGGLTDTDEVSITVNAEQPPVADAGADRFVLSQQQDVTLDGTDSSDADSTIASYSWVQIAGPGGITLSNANTATPSFDVPSLPVGQKITFRLTVTDADGLSDTDDVVVEVAAPLAVSYGVGVNSDAGGGGFAIDSAAFAFTITASEPIGNWFVSQLSASPNPRGPALNETLDDAGNHCTGGPQGTAAITCDQFFVTYWLGTDIGGCTIDSEADQFTNATLSADARTLTFNVACVTGDAVTANSSVGIGANANPGSHDPLNPVRSNVTGDLEVITGACSINGQGEVSC